MLERVAAGAFLAPGLGKTIIMLTVFYILQRRKLAKKMLVVSKRRIIYQVWPKEIKKWNLDFSICILHGSKKSQRLKEEADIYLINYEGLAWLQRQPKKLRSQFDVLCLDESSMVKGWMSQRTGALKKMLSFFSRRYILTGSPIPNGYMDLFAQIFMLDAGDALGRFIKKFRNSYFMPSGFKGYGWTMQEGAQDKIHEAIEHLIIRYGNDELDLPPLIPDIRTVQLGEKARKVYRAMEEDFITNLNKGTIVASNAGVASGKCRQIAGGAVYPNVRKKGYEVVHEEKLDELENLLEELQGHPVLIAYEFDHERIRIQKRFPKIPHIGGGTSDKRSAYLEDKWNEGKLPALLGHPASIAYGLNMQGIAADLCFFSAGWNLEHHDQFKQRVWRQGQAKTVVCHYIMAEDTIDDIISEAIEDKITTQNGLFAALQAKYNKPVRAQKMATHTWKKVKLPNKKRDPDMVANALKQIILEGPEKTLRFRLLPIYDHRQARKDEPLADYNFVFGFLQIFGAWSQAKHIQFLKKVFGEVIDVDITKASSHAKLHDMTERVVMEMLKADSTDALHPKSYGINPATGKGWCKCYVLMDREHALKVWPMTRETVKEDSKMATKKSGSKFAGSNKKAAKKTTKKTASKKKAAKTAGMDPKAKVTRGRSKPNGGIYVDLVGCIPKSGISVGALCTAFKKKSKHKRAKDSGFVQGYIRGGVRRGYLKLA
jgi:hypothetical protein